MAAGDDVAQATMKHFGGLSQTAPAAKIRGTREARE